MKRRIIRSLILLLLLVSLSNVSHCPVQAASVKAPSQVTKFKATTVSTQATKLSWKKVSKAGGYQVYIKTSKTKWKKLSNIKSSKTSYTVRGLKSNTTYQYRIRAYKSYKVKGKTKYKYGKYSKVISSKTKKILKTFVLKDGYYTAGIDIPAGVYDVSGIAGIGYIDSKYKGVNLCGPGYSKYSNEYARTYDNYKLAKGYILEVKGVQVKLNYSSVSSNITGRVYDTSSGIKFSPGEYIVGKDIEAGRYCVKYVSGEGGYVSSDRDSGDCILSSNMDGDSKTGEYVDYVSNVILKTGEKIEVSDGLTVLFIPEKK